MSRLTVDPSGTHVLRDGQYLPLVVDTAWSTFTDASPQDWRTYLGVRRRQGFTAVLVSAQPILHDRADRPGQREPWAVDADGRYDFARIDDDYLAVAREYTRIAHEEVGLVLLVGVLWNNYLPGTWGAAATPHAVMPDDARRAWVVACATTFGDLEPIFVVGGDDLYDVPAANAAYVEAAAILRQHAPHSLLTTHTAPRATLPDELADTLDLYLHQSGHNVENQDLTWQQAAGYLARTPRRPLLASEPPYEQHGKVGGHGRWTREDVRRASWTSVLAGATAGIGYAAHGTWMWHVPGAQFQARGPSLEPFPWQEALAFPGALDVSLMARLFVDHRLDRLLPAQDLLADDADGEVRLATSPDRALVVLYLPYALEVTVDLDLSGYRLTAWDLAERAPMTPDLDGRTLRQLTSRGDQLVVAERRR